MAERTPMQLVLGLILLAMFFFGVTTLYAAICPENEEGKRECINPFERKFLLVEAVRCSYWRCAEGCGGRVLSIEKGDFKCSDFCRKEWTDTKKEDGRICGPTPFDVAITLDKGDPLSKKKVDFDVGCIVATDDISQYSYDKWIIVNENLVKKKGNPEECRYRAGGPVISGIKGLDSESGEFHIWSVESCLPFRISCGIYTIINDTNPAMDKLLSCCKDCSSCPGDICDYCKKYGYDKCYFNEGDKYCHSKDDKLSCLNDDDLTIDYHCRAICGGPYSKCWCEGDEVKVECKCGEISSCEDYEDESSCINDNLGCQVGFGVCVGGCQWDPNQGCYCGGCENYFRIRMRNIEDSACSATSKTNDQIELTDCVEYVTFRSGERCIKFVGKGEECEPVACNDGTSIEYVGFDPDPKPFVSKEYQTRIDIEISSKKIKTEHPKDCCSDCSSCSVDMCGYCKDFRFDKCYFNEVDSQCYSIDETPSCSGGLLPGDEYYCQAVCDGDFSKCWCEGDEVKVECKCGEISSCEDYEDDEFACLHDFEGCNVGINCGSGECVFDSGGCHC